MKTLLNDYKLRLEAVKKLLDSNVNNGSIVHQRRNERLITKESEYRAFIVEIEKAIVRHEDEQLTTPTNEPAKVRNETAPKMGAEEIDGEFISDLARKYANICEFKSDFPHHWKSVFDGYNEGFKTGQRLEQYHASQQDELVSEKHIAMIAEACVLLNRIAVEVDSRKNIQVNDVDKPLSILRSILHDLEPDDELPEPPK